MGRFCVKEDVDCERLDQFPPFVHLQFVLCQFLRFAVYVLLEISNAVEEYALLRCW